MADPLSFVASIVAVTDLAATVTSKGYRYLKAVTNCPQEVRDLMVEVNVLCGTLDRLVVLLRSTKSDSKRKRTTEKSSRLDSEANDNEDKDSIDSAESDGELTTANRALEAPDFIYECQKVLNEIEIVLNGFVQMNPPSLSSGGRNPGGKSSRLEFSNLKRLDAKALKWPLKTSRTLQLIGALERHKSTCMIALGELSLAAVHSVLEQTQNSNKHLIELKAKQEKLLDISITQEEIKALRWLSPVDAAAKLQAFRRERQGGTGKWLFDLSEMSHWLDNSKEALWIYGIPGAGKTVLSTLVVDEVFSRKRSKSVGTAYFYIRHDDMESHKPWNVLGSLMSQLARQNKTALDIVMEKHKQAFTNGPSATAIDDDDLDQLFHQILQNFECVYIMIDGLDECGAVFDSCRKRLIETVSELHRIEEKSIRTLVFSRDENDIRKQLTATGFRAVSISATSADLRLFTHAWLPSLEIQSEKLKIEIVDSLVEQSDGIDAGTVILDLHAHPSVRFMWVRAQIDYLQRLPSDFEKRRALEHLPPDLPQTYIRIFQTMESSYPKPTKKLIQRLLKWLVLSEELTRSTFFIHIYRERLTLPIADFCHMICIENEHDWPSDQNVPTPDQISHWLGCLISKSGDDSIQFSHFTVREFLTMNPEEILNTSIQEYLASPTDNDILKICFRCLTHDHFKNVVLDNDNETMSFLSKNPLYQYAARRAFYILCSLDEDKNELELERLLHRFLSSSLNTFWGLWATCVEPLIRIDRLEGFGDYRDGLPLFPFRFSRPQIVVFPLQFSPLKVAAFAGLDNQVERLLREGVDPNPPNATLEAGFTSLHFAIVSGMPSYVSALEDGICLILGIDDYLLADKQQAQGLRASRLLLAFGASIKQQLLLDIDFRGGTMEKSRFRSVLTPLVLALIVCNYEVAGLLLEAGANWNATASPSKEGVDEKGILDLCSIRTLLTKIPEREEMIKRIADVGGHFELNEALQQWRALRKTVKESNSQTLFVEALKREDWKAVKELLETHTDIDINYIDERGENAIFSASLGPEATLRCLLEHGASPNAPLPSGKSPLCRVISQSCIGNMKLLLEFGADIEHRVPDGSTPLLYAAANRQYKALQLLLDSGADVNATLNDGSSALLVNGVVEDEAYFSLLLARGIDPNTPDHYGRLPLHLACEHGLEAQADKLINLAADTFDSINQNDINNGTPLYLATRKGFYNTVKLLLDGKASIDKTGPGNVLGSALMVACAEGHTEIVKLLLERGASLEVEGSRFLSAQGTAQAFRQEAVLKVLEEHTREDRPQEHCQQIEEARDNISGGVDDEQGLLDEGEKEDSNAM